MSIHDQIGIEVRKVWFEPNLGAWLYDKVNGILNDACQATQEFREENWDLRLS